MDASTAAKQIVRFEIFRSLAQHPSALEALLPHIRLQAFEPRELIIDERAQDNRVYFLVFGQASVQKIDERGQIVVVGRADAAGHPYFGESALLGKLARSASVAAHTRCECLSLSAKDFESFMNAHPFVAASIYRSMASVLLDRLAKADRDLLFAGID